MEIELKYHIGDSDVIDRIFSDEKIVAITDRNSEETIEMQAAYFDTEDRRLSREKRMRLKCIATVVKVSDPNRNWDWMRIREVLELAGMGVKNLSAVPWRFIPELRARFPELQAYREQSRQEGAFLPANPNK